MNYKAFVEESNSIEGIYRDAFPEEITELERFVAVKHMTIGDLQQFVSVYEPGAQLRDKKGMNVCVGTYYPPFGGPDIFEQLQGLLDEAIISAKMSPLAQHIYYELLHPFTDCNGRSGRALWLWRMKRIEGSFLYNFYMQTLKEV